MGEYHFYLRSSKKYRLFESLEENQIKLICFPHHRRYLKIRRGDILIFINGMKRIEKVIIDEYLFSNLEEITQYFDIHDFGPFETSNDFIFHHRNFIGNHLVVVMKLYQRIQKNSFYNS